MLSRAHNYSVSIVQLALPHYNVPFYSLLAKNINGRLQIITGPYFWGGSPLSVKNTHGLDRINIHNTFIANQLAVQFPLPEVVFSSTIAVLEFNPRILSNLWIMICRRKLGRATVLWGHGLSRRLNSPSWAKTIKKWMASESDALIFYSDKGKQDFGSLGIPSEKLFVAYNSVDVQGIGQMDAPAFSQRLHILFIGRLVIGKKIELLLQGFTSALPRLPAGTKLNIIGDGPHRSNLVAYAKELGCLHRINFVGEITDERLLSQYFSQSLLSVYPTAIGLAAIHSLAYGVPILVAKNEPHGPEVEVLVEGRNCEYFSADDAGDLAKKIIDLLNQPHKLSSLGQVGHEDVTAKYSLQQMATVFVNVFDTVGK